MHADCHNTSLYPIFHRRREHQQSWSSLRELATAAARRRRHVTQEAAEGKTLESHNYIWTGLI